MISFLQDFMYQYLQLDLINDSYNHIVIYVLSYLAFVITLVLLVNFIIYLARKVFSFITLFI